MEKGKKPSNSTNQFVENNETSNVQTLTSTITTPRHSLAGRAARAPLTWVVSGAELIATTTAEVALSTVHAAFKTASVLASTTEAVGNVVASTTTNVALTSASVATQTATIITNATSVGAKTAGDTIAGAATLVAEGLGASNNHNISPKNGFHTRDGRARSRSGDSSTPLSPGARMAFFATAQGNGKSSSQEMRLPEAMSLGASLDQSGENIEERHSSLKKRNVGSRLWCLLGATNISARTHWIATVTSSKPSPPSAKYLKKIVALAWETKGQSVDEFYKLLHDRPVTSSANCALKALITSLRLVREGPPEALQSSIMNVGFIDAMGAVWAERVLVDVSPTETDRRSTSPHEFGKDDIHEQMLIARLSGLIVQKMHFHSKQSYLNARYESLGINAESDTSDGDDDPWERDVQTSSSLLTLLGTIEGVARLALGMGGPNRTNAPPTTAALSLSALLIEEALSVFDALSTSLLATSCYKNQDVRDQDTNLFKSLMNRYQEAYDAMRVYSTAALQFPYIVELKKVPILNNELNPLGDRYSVAGTTCSPTHSQQDTSKSLNLLANRPFTRRSILETLEEEEALEHRLVSHESGQEETDSLTLNESKGEMIECEPKSPQTGIFDPWEYSSNSIEHARPPLQFYLDSEEGAASDENEFVFEEETPVRNKTLGNPFDTGNSSIVLLAAAHRSAFSTITNPFASGQFNAFTTNQLLSKQQLEQQQKLAQATHPQHDATKRALDQCMQLFEFSGVNIDPSDLIISQETIGRGAFSLVHRGTLKTTGEEVAVKKLSIEELGRSPETILDFRAEVALMKAVHHPNVLKLIGACASPDLCLVSEFCHRGNLFDFIYLDRESNPKQSKVLTWQLRIKLALGEARGMHFLHTAFPVPLIHRDLKSLNLLLSKNWTLKVSDFGLSRFRRKGVVDGPCGTTQWMAPEVIEGKSYDEKADIYSFGVNLWELVTRRVPWEGYTDVKQRVMNGERLPLDPSILDANCPPKLLELIQKCWSHDPEKRPEFAEIVNELKYIAKSL